MGYYDFDKNKAFLTGQKALIIDECLIHLLTAASREKYEVPGGLLEPDEDFAVGLKKEACEAITHFSPLVALAPVAYYRLAVC